MWIMTTVGFFSVIENTNKDYLTVRARVRKDLDDLRDHYMPELHVTHETPEKDYPFRAYIRREFFSDGIAKAAKDINYSNFKNAVKRWQGKQRESVYSKVWGILLELEGQTGVFRRLEAWKKDVQNFNKEKTQ